MKLFFMKQSAIDYMKANMNSLYMNYFRYTTNEWINDLFEYDPFEFFTEVSDFDLMEISDPVGKTDLENAKILYRSLKRISESQAADERLWAGLCNGVFYEYVRERWGYSSLRPKNPERDGSTIISRFYFAGGGLSGKFRNTLAKYWWIGRYTYSNIGTDHWILLDEIGPEDFTSKVNEIFYSNTFSANHDILNGICNGIEFFRSRDIYVSARKHLRPTLQYLNALGGGILLDELRTEDITSIVIESIGKLLKGEQSDIVLTDDQEDDADEEDIDELNNDTGVEVNVNYEEEQEILEEEIENVDIHEVLDNPDIVERGCSVTVLKNHDKNIIYRIPLENESRELYVIEEKLLGKHVGDRITMYSDEYEVVEINW